LRRFVHGQRFIARHADGVERLFDFGIARGKAPRPPSTEEGILELETTPIFVDDIYDVGNERGVILSGLPYSCIPMDLGVLPGWYDGLMLDENRVIALRKVRGPASFCAVCCSSCAQSSAELESENGGHVIDVFDIGKPRYSSRVTTA
jgi:hypothetical protein